MPQFGRQVLGSVGEPFMTLARLEGAEWKPGGATIDWNTVAAVSGSAVTLNNGDMIAVGQKYLRYGQLICRITSTANGGIVGYYGPYDPAATDGRQTPVRGAAYLLNVNMFQFAPLGLTTHATDYAGGAFDAGTVWKARLLQVGTGTASLAAGPQLATLETLFPALRYAQVNS